MKEITVVICTRNRYENLKECINSILKNDENLYEILIVDQSTDDKTENFVKNLKNKNIRYIKTDTKGLSRARNIAILNVKTKYLVFTDDDCIVTESWIEDILKEYKKDEKIWGVYGKVLPYGDKSKDGYFCHCLIESDKRSECSNPVIPHNYLGHGNNMSFKTEIFKTVGLYNEKLGAGTWMQSGEDTDFIYRVLRKRFKVIYSPIPTVFHNSWKTMDEAEKLDYGYVKGFVTIFSKYAFKGDFVAIKALVLRLYQLFKDIFLALRYKNFKKVFTTSKKVFIYFYSIPIGFYFLLCGDPTYKSMEKKYASINEMVDTIHLSN